MAAFEEQGIDPQRLANRMRMAARVAPTELEQGIAKSAKLRVLPLARSRTPVSSGKLREATTVRLRRREGFDTANVELYNSLPYAATIHWGRKWVAYPGTQRRPGQVGVDNVVKGRPFVYSAVLDRRDDLERDLKQTVDKILGGGLNG